MITKLIIGAAIGASAGGLLGSTRSCADGGCPLTANPWRGALWGGFLGVLLAMSFTSSGARHASTHERTDGRPAPVAPIETDEQFTSEVRQRKGLAMVTFHADWCGACASFAPVFDRTAERFAPTVAFFRIDADRAGKLTADMSVDALPTTILFENGQEKTRIVGATDAEALAQALEKSSTQAPGN